MIVYYSQPDFTDCDFPLIRAMQLRGIRVKYYIEIHSYNLKRGLLNISHQYPENGIFNASIYKEISEYSNYICLDDVYVVNCIHQSDFHPMSIKLQLRLIWQFLKKDVDIVHIVWPLVRNKLLWSILRKKLVLTLHDPFPHSNKKTIELEACRKWSFKIINRIIILSKQFVDEFSDAYHYPKGHIFVSKLGTYDCINYVTPKSLEIKQDYILFFGYISFYKGIEFLLNAMEMVHSKHPEVKLIVAGGGQYYFDITKYINSNYIEFRNHYVDLQELALLLNGCLFMVCPYRDATQSGVVQTAYAKNTPIVATNVGAFPVYVEDGVTGMIVPPCDADALAAAMIELIDNPDRLKMMRINIEKMRREKLNWDEIVNDYITCYNTMVNRIR